MLLQKPPVLNNLAKKEEYYFKTRQTQWIRKQRHCHHDHY